MSGQKVLTHSFTHKHSHIISDISTILKDSITNCASNKAAKKITCMFVTLQLRNGWTNSDGTWYECRLYPELSYGQLFMRASGAVRVSECYVYFCFVSDTKRPVKPMQPRLNSPNSSGTEPRPLASDHQQAVCAHQAGCAGHVHGPYVWD